MNIDNNYNLFTTFGVEPPPIVIKENKNNKAKETTPKTIKEVNNADEDIDENDTDGGEEKKKNKAKAPAAKKITAGEVTVKVYGMELMRFTLEEDKEEATVLEEIREKLVTDYGYAEFSKERTSMSYSGESRIIVPSIGFQKKG